MFRFIRDFMFLIKVQAEIKAQTGNQEIVNRLCESQEVVEIIKQFNEILRTHNGYNSKVAAFMALFPVYAFALTRNTYTLEEKIRIATWLNDANEKAIKKVDFYNNYLEIFLSSQRKMHEFCIENNLNPDTLISNKKINRISADEAPTNMEAKNNPGLRVQQPKIERLTDTGSVADIPPLTNIATKALEHAMACNIVILNVQELTDATKTMVVCTGTSSDHVRSAAQSVIREISQNGYSVNSLEGMDIGEWVLIDIGDLVIHILQPEQRAFYNLEKKWGGIGNQ